MGRIRVMQPGADVQVRHVQPYEAVKTYRCPGCDHEIPPGLGHEVVVPVGAPADRRHWHTSCWARAQRVKAQAPPSERPRRRYPAPQ
jgi:hypothetical protein